jgi:hypothetical protein
MIVERGLFWTPRVLGVLFAAFLSIFALDVFGEGYGFWGTILALVMHLIPTLVVLAVLAIAWRWEAVGGILFIALGAWCLIAPLGPKDPVISGPPFVLGGLFLIHWAYQARHRRLLAGKRP